MAEEQGPKIELDYTNLGLSKAAQDRVNKALKEALEAELTSKGEQRGNFHANQSVRS